MNIKPRLGGGKSGDPTLYIDLIDRKRGILFDCGLFYFRHALLRKVSDVFISHTHIDHFIGFDTLLRLNLTEERTIQVFGPPGITQNVIGKLQAYTWNICQNLGLTIRVHEVLPEKIVLTELESWKGFAVKSIGERPHAHRILTSDEFSVDYIQLNHKIPSYGYSFLEADSCNVQKDVMQDMGLEPGPWVAHLKALAFDPGAEKQTLQIRGVEYSCRELLHKLLVRKSGLKITYLTDFLFEEHRADDIVKFAWKSDILFCEAAFAQQDKAKAKMTHHLTAREAGKLARLSQAKQLVLFHFSKRYQDYSMLLNEATQEFPNVE
ncbi:hypothetical protein CSA56_04170 [candidate division KSB3 bacterium]|uniref:Uncharacterized protein n=1 Tax=candidate division KSB3 bacterium TaxID=2044937 RepID=A0A2G6KID4_9BACT|nr:MAG: hypothetical protein CSA56_04170 [candidate division KSB3 bacterium]